MYDYLKGHLVSKQINSYLGAHIVVDVNNIGYLIHTGKRTIERIQDDEVKVYVSLTHKEDTMSLTGFITKEERDIFNILQSVSGIGVKLALLILDELSRAKGVGAKVAQKIILELKDKLVNWANITPVDVEDIKLTTEVNQEAIVEVQSVLVSLGYSVNEAKNAIKEVLNHKKDSTKTEDILKYSLEYLSRLS